MDSNTMLLLGMVKLYNPNTKQTELIEAKGFDVMGLFFPFLRYLFAGMFGSAAIAFVACITLIGYPICSWYTAFNFKKMRFEHMIKSGWQIAQEKAPTNHQANAA